jgi:sRNA-binding regulator protein Hfq
MGQSARKTSLISRLWATLPADGGAVMKTLQMRSRLSIAGVALLLVLAPLARLAQAQPQSRDEQKTTSVKAAVEKRLANKKTKVKVKLRSGEQLKGQISQSDDNGFTITQDKTNSLVKISYADVEKVSGRGGLSTAAKIGIIAGIAVGVLAIVVIVAVRNFDPFSGGITVR